MLVRVLAAAWRETRYTTTLVPYRCLTGEMQSHSTDAEIMSRPMTEWVHKRPWERHAGFDLVYCRRPLLLAFGL